MSVIAGLQDFRKEGPPADIGTFQLPCSVLVFRHTFSGVAYVCAVRSDVRGWVLISYNTDASTVLQAAHNAISEGKIIVKDALTLTVSFLWTNPSITLEGENPSKTILTLANNKNVDLIEIGNNGAVDTPVNFTIKNLTLNGNKAGQTTNGRGIHVRTTTDLLIRGVIENVVVHDCFEEGIYEEVGRSITYALIRSYANNRSGIKIANSDNNLQNIICHSNGLCGLELNAGSEHLSNFHMWGNGALGGTWDLRSGIRVGGSCCTIVNGECELNEQVGLYIAGANNSVDAVLCWDNGTVANAGRQFALEGGVCTYNRITNFSAYDDRGAGAHSAYGIRDLGGDYNLFKNGDVHLGHATANIAMSAGTHNRVEDCIGYNPVGRIATPWSHTLGNFILDTAGTTANILSATTHTVGQSPKLIVWSGGTVSAVTVDGVATGLTTPGSVFLKVGQTFSITWTGQPAAIVYAG